MSEHTDRYKEGRARTVLMSMVAAGLVALFISSVYEVKTYNAQAERSRTNCGLINDDRRADYESFDDQADRVLGDNSAADGDPAENIPPLDFEATGFANVKALSVATAKVNRQRSRSARDRIVDCKEIHPKRKTLGFIE